MDYRRFLATTESMVLPYLGGLSVHAADRRLRVCECVAAGWRRFAIAGRDATPQEPSDPIDLSDRPVVRGHLVGEWLFVAGNTVERVYLLPPDEPAVLAPVKARRWWSGDHLFDELPFEQEVDEQARAALLAGGGSLVGIKGVTPSLRAAFGFAVLHREAAQAGLRVSAREVIGQVHAIASGTRTPAQILAELSARRFAVTRNAIRSRPARSHDPRTRDNADRRICEALEPTGAAVLVTRQQGERAIEVTFRYQGQQFIAIVDWETLHVYDAGICLQGHDEELGLDSLPAVIAEAIETGQLHITHW